MTVVKEEIPLDGQIDNKQTNRQTDRQTKDRHQAMIGAEKEIRTDGLSHNDTDSQTVKLAISGEEEG